MSRRPSGAAAAPNAPGATGGAGEGWRAAFEDAHGRVLAAMRELGTAGASEEADAARDEAEAAPRVAKFGALLGGVERAEETAAPQAAGRDEGATRAELEGVLFQIKSELLPELETCLERGIAAHERAASKTPGGSAGGGGSQSWLGAQETLERYMATYELVEAVCRSLTAHSSGDVLGTYQVVLKARPFFEDDTGD
jgi:hypothetical protein